MNMDEQRLPDSALPAVVLIDASNAETVDAPVPAPRSDAETLAWLTGLAPLEYDRERKAAAALLKVRPLTLDKQVKAKGAELADAAKRAEAQARHDADVQAERERIERLATHRPVELPPDAFGAGGPVALVVEDHTHNQPRTADDDGKPRAQATVLTEIGQQHHLFHDEGGDAYAAIPAGAGTVVLAITGSDYRELLGRDYYRLAGKGANRNAVGDAVNTLSAIAKHDGPCESVFLRVGIAGEGIALDLGDGHHRAIVITGDGWELVDTAPVRFRRSGKPTPLPEPTTAELSPLWRVLNVSAPDRPLVLAWLLAALRPRGPYPVLTLVGEQGSAKSSAARILKSLIDPSAVLLRGPVKDERDLLVAARSSWVVTLDNLSGIDAQLSDALCRIATGGGLAARKLYTDHDETLIEVQRPVILNGIDELASRPDLAQRCIQIELPVIPESERRTEAAVWADFKLHAPAIFAALLDGVVRALRDVKTIKLANLPRMADFALWAAAGLPALGIDPDDFLTAYRDKQAQGIEDGLETSALARALRRFIERHGQWQGSKLYLLELLASEASDHDRALPGWPRTPRGLTNTLRRLAPSLRHIGITFAEDRSRDARTITMRCDPSCTSSKQASQTSSVTDPSLARDALTLVTHAKPVCMIVRPDDPTRGQVFEGEVL